MLSLSRMLTIGLPVLALATVGKLYVYPVKAASPARVLTVTGAELGIGIIVVDQQSGAVDFCADYVANTTPVGKCGKIGHVTPSPSLPTPPAGLSVVAPSTGNVGATGNGTSGASVYIVNNQTGDIAQCGYFSSGGTPVGTCVDLGVAPQ
jgi:hypothetical protein